MRNRIRCAFAFGAAILLFGTAVTAGEPQSRPPVANTAPEQAAADPFAELLKNHPSEVVSTGPSCKVVKVQLPPGVTVDDIPALGK